MLYLLLAAYGRSVSLPGVSLHCSYCFLKNVPGRRGLKIKNKNKIKKDAHTGEIIIGEKKKEKSLLVLSPMAWFS